MGGATTPSYVETTSEAPPRCLARSSAIIDGTTKGMSPSSTTPAEALSGRARKPARTEVFMPRRYSSFTIGVQERPRSSSRMWSLSWPSTTKTGSRPAASAVSTARRRTVVPPSGRRSLLRPMRVDCPAASTMPATGASPIMDASRLVAQMHGRPSRSDGEHLRDDAHGDLLGAVGRDVETHGSVEAFRGGDADLLQDLLPAGPRTEQSEVADRLLEQGLEPALVVHKRMGLHDRGVPAGESEPGDSVLGSAQQQPRRGGKPLRGQVCRPVIDDRDLESGLRGERGERAGIVAGAEEEEMWRRIEDLDEEAGVGHLPHPRTPPLDSP